VYRFSTSDRVESVTRGFWTVNLVIAVAGPY